jgi:hypothetical protein
MPDYTTITILGRGGFGVVDEVIDKHGAKFARKKFEPASYIPSDAHDKLRKRFRREVLIQAELGGNEIMPVLRHDLDCPTPWFVMPLADKIYEAQLVEDKARGSVDIDAIADILNGLERLHKLGYVHRDLNPKNILLHEGHWKLSDFGAVLPPSGRTITLTEGTVIYTEQYCSPEQRNDFHKAQPPADIFAFGCILHDIFGAGPRTPYARQTAAGEIGIIIEKCTEQNPSRRPSISALRGMVIQTLVDIGGHCKIEDEKSEEWLEKLNSIESWDGAEFENFARFFAQLDLKERSHGHEYEWVLSLSTPFLTRVPPEALVKIVERRDGIADAIIEKYCEWVHSTSFEFYFSDIIGDRLACIFDHGTPTQKALALTALIRLAESHNRWYVMRKMLERCSNTATTKDVAQRLRIEIQTEELESRFRRCIDEVKWDASTLSSELAKLCK